MTANVENIRKWVEALRSGRYEQTSGTLAAVDIDGKITGHCCLGVACEVAGIVPRVAHQEARYDGDSVKLPQTAQDWLGISEANPELSTDSIAKALPRWPVDTSCESSLAGLNDGGATFTEIANLIEAEWLTAEASA